MDWILLELILTLFLQVAPIGLILVTIMLYLFRKVYSEAVTAIPVNGGTYNIVLNTAQKKTAAFVSCLSILSYTATAIISAFDGVVYLSLLWPSVGQLLSSLLFCTWSFLTLLADIRGFTILVLSVFAVIVICGVGESSYVSMVMFVIHIGILSLLIIWGFAYGCQDNFQVFKDNMNTPYPDIYSSSGQLLARNSGLAAVFFGYCTALLGITGFESAANYVEEMKGPIFPATINALWYGIHFQI